jgi:HK97 family phage prohead protease
MTQLAEVFQKLFPPAAGRKIDVNAVRRAAFVPEIRSLDEKKRTMEIVSSTETPDRYKDVLRSAGFQTENYMRGGGLILWAHDSHSPSIAKTLSIRTETNPPALVQTIEFADKATYEFADQIFRLYQQKFLRSFSVGFRPLQAPEPIVDKDGASTGGFLFTSMDLIEVSAVPCPANPDCVARAVGSGIIAAADAARVFVAEAPDLQDFDARLSVLEMEMDALRRDVGRLRRGDVETLSDLESLLKGER